MSDRCRPHRARACQKCAPATHGRTTREDLAHTLHDSRCSQPCDPQTYADDFQRADAVLARFDVRRKA